MGQEKPATIPDESARALLAANDAGAAATLVLRTFGPEVLGFLHGMLRNEADADEVFATTSERLWRSLGSFEWRCSLRTWLYVIARHEAMRFVRGTQRQGARRASASALDDVVAVVRTETQSALRTEKRTKLIALRDELAHDDRTLLILRLDREMSFEDIALAFLSDVETCSAEQIKREAARLRKRYQLVRERLAKRAREEGLLST